MDEHEQIISTELGMPKIKDKHFSDFDGSIKSLGAWGGDFCMVASKLSSVEISSYFASKGLNTVLSYEDMALKYTPELASSEAVAG